MSKSKYVLISAMLLGAVPLISVAYAEGEQAQAPVAQDQSAQAPAPAADDQAPDAQAPEGQTPSDPQAPASDAPQGSSTGAQAQAMQNPDTDTQDQPDPAHPYEIKSFFADFQRFTIGSVIPDRYRTKKYEIVDWKTRNLSKPDEGTGWTYMGGNYVLFNKADGKIIKAESGDIFYKQS
ncbi:RcnB family protein [Pantoea sp. BAV 3049]|uniref:RcnB family protein n=1 Tax=Pantoea sp. BAV 3049 TaxID=2654188 RepID=UPI00131D08D5|nr:RcnB family protein [Pantoea sp. BAV 3049]